MKQKSRLIIPDADVIIDLHKLGYWDKFVREWRVLVADTVAGIEVSFYETGPDELRRHVPIDLKAASEDNLIAIRSADSSQLQEVLRCAASMQAETIDDGERESICIAHSEPDSFLCLCDQAAIRFAVLVGLADRLLSVEKALEACGITAKIEDKLTESRFSDIVRKAKEDRVQRLDL